MKMLQMNNKITVTEKKNNLITLLHIDWNKTTLFKYYKYMCICGLNWKLARPTHTLLLILNITYRSGWHYSKIHPNLSLTLRLTNHKLFFFFSLPFLFFFILRFEILRSHLCWFFSFSFSLFYTFPTFTLHHLGVRFFFFSSSLFLSSQNLIVFILHWKESSSFFYY